MTLPTGPSPEASGIDLPTSACQRLRSKIELVLPDLTATGRALVDHPRLAELYPPYLFALHCMMRAGVPLMEAARARALPLGPDDPVAAGLVPYFDHHIPEERHPHWPLEDLEVLGYPRATVLARIPSPTVAALVGAQYYWIEHYHPVALLGYLEVAEGYPPTKELVAELIAKTGYPRSAFRAMARHAALDLRHRRDLHRMIDGLPLTPTQEALIGLSAIQTVQLWDQALGEILGQ
jgi:hypothetical protein